MAPFRYALLVTLVTSAFFPVIASGQDPWTVTVSTAPTVPIGQCSAVWLDILDVKTRDVPRNPNGDRVTVADFDVTMSGATVALEYRDAYHVRACACQSAAVGSSATVTAVYPASVLPASTRVTGVSAKGSGTFRVGKPDNKVNPPACTTPGVAPRTAVVVAAMKQTTATTASRTPAPLAPAPIPIPVRTSAPAPVIAPPTSVTTIPTTSVPSSPVGTSGGRTASTSPAPTPLSFPSAPILPPGPGAQVFGTPISSGTTRAAQGAIPTGLKLVPNVPIIASLVWDAMPNAVTYSLRRGVGTGAPVERVSRSASAEKGARDTIPDPRDTYLYSLFVTYADGSFNTSPTVEFVSPPLKNPAGFTATHTGDGNVDFQWQSVPGAASYRLDGPGFPGAGLNVATTSGTYTRIPGGANTWKLTTLYQGNFADYANPSMVSVMMRYVPPHTTPWLSKNNGGGSMETVQMPSLGFMACDLQAWSYCTNETEPPSIMQKYDPNAKYPFGSPSFLYGSASTFIRIKVWLGENYDKFYPGVNYDLWDDPGQDTVEAVYGNAVDLGVGRRSSCFQSMRVRGGWDPITDRLIIPSAWPGMHTVCYASAHGIAPGEPGFNDPAAITQPGTKENRLLTMVIKKDPTGTVFMVFKPTAGYTLSPTVALDTEGEKYVPHACLACHGGTYNEKTRKVDGASFLPLDPGLLEFASPAEQASQEEKLRKINAMIVASDPKSAVALYINGLYGNAVVRPGTKAKVDYVPQGWSEQPGFYRSLVKPYCATCHLAAPESRNLASWQNFQQNSALIKAHVCNLRTMPHSELQYKAFWTKDTGPVYLPGLLAATLNWPGNTPGAPPSCP